MGKGQSLLVKIVGPRLDWEGAGVGLEKGTDPGEDILESREGGWGVPQTKERNPPGKTCFKARPPAGRPKLWAQLHWCDPGPTVSVSCLRRFKAQSRKGWLYH